MSERAVVARAVRRFIRVLLFLLCFAVEFRVHAETADTVQLRLSADLLEQPSGCWKKGGACAVRSRDGERTVLTLGTATINLDQASTIARLSPNEIRLVAGTIWVKSTEPLTVRSEFGAFEAPPGEYWVARTADRMTVSAIEGTVIMKPRGAEDVALEVEAGAQNWLGRVGPDGRARTGVPIAIPLSEHLLRWARLYPGTRAKFEQEARAFHEHWAEAAAVAAEIHRELYVRKTASLAAKRAEDDAARRRAEARNRELRDLFRRKLEED